MKYQAETQKEQHLYKTEAARSDIDAFHNLKDDSKITFGFDLQKIMPTVNVTNSKAYYLHHLWTYHLNISKFKSGTIHKYTWHEGQAFPDCQDIAFCSLMFVKTLLSEVRPVTAFSGNYRGLNKRNLIVKF